jgi:hypothetical protein
MLPIIYHYTVDGLFLGIGQADESPLEPGVWLTPAYATDIEPPAVPAGQQAIFADGAWQLQDIPEPEPEPESVPGEPEG